MSRSNNFFAEFVKDDFFEKKASENENVKNALGGVTPSVLEKLAEEIGAICSQEEAMTLEQKLASEDEPVKEDEQNKEVSKQEGSDADAENKTKEEVSEGKEAECGADEKTDEKSEEKKESACKSAEDEECSKTDESCKEDKESAEEDTKEEDDQEKEIVKKAYELAEQKLAARGLSVEDYVFQKTANEEVSEFIADYAEKLAFLSDRSTLQVADEIITSVIEKLG